MTMTQPSARRSLAAQTWPEDLDLSGKRVVVIGSGATAATLIPAIAADAAHVTMLQRSPTFFLARPRTHELANTLRALDVPEEWTHEILRRAHIAELNELTRMSFETPEELRTLLIEGMRAQLPPGYDVDKHFNPRYRPWQQRIAMLPDGDLFAAIREGKASVATDTIERFTETGIRLASGEVLEADVVVTATGFDLSAFGDIAFRVDEEPVDFANTVTYRGLMFTGLPNLAYVFGYFRHSWTLRADLISDFVCRLLAHLAEKGATTVVPRLRDKDADMPLRPWVDPENFNPGYLSRSLHLMPKQGDREPWTHLHEYVEERELLPAADLDDGTLVYRRVRHRRPRRRSAVPRPPWGAAAGVPASDDAAGGVVAVHVVHRHDLHDVAGGGRVHHQAVADVHAHVPDRAVEEDQVTGQQLVPRHRDAHRRLHGRRVRQADARGCVRVLGQPRAVERVRARTAPHVGLALLGQGGVHGYLGRGVRCDHRRRGRGDGRRALGRLGRQRTERDPGPDEQGDARATGEKGRTG
jgi:hypothetical protein